MGEVISYIVKFITSGFSACNHTNISVMSNCCKSAGEKLDIEEIRDENDNLLTDYEYYVANDKILRPYFIFSRVAYFKCDVNGVATQCSDTMENFVGLSREENLKSINWVANIPKNNYEEYEKWLKNVRAQNHCVKKMHFQFARGELTINRYVVVESRPIFNEINYYFEGIKGVILNIPLAVWMAFDDAGGIIVK